MTDSTPDTAAGPAPHPLTPSGLGFTVRLTRAWWREARRRWPAAVGVMRGREVAFGLTIGPPARALIDIKHAGAVIMDCTLVGGSTAVTVSRSNAAEVR